MGAFSACTPAGADPAGQQTVQVVDNTQPDAGSITASGRGTSNGTTVVRATPSIATTPTPTITIGTGQLADAATVLGRISPQAGATIDFRLYGPNAATCSGAPVFESLGVPYPIGEGSVTSAPFTPTAAGVYRWIATYSGDANNFSVAGLCSDASETVTVAEVVPDVVSLAPGAELPATGSPSRSIIYLAICVTMIGCIFVGSARRRDGRATGSVRA